MKTLNRITTAVLGTTLALSPMMALAHGDEQHDVQNDNGDRKGFLTNIFRGYDDRGGARVKIDDGASEHAEAGKHDEDANHDKNDDKGGVRADAKVGIDARIDALERLSSRIDGASRLSADARANLITMLDARIAALVALKAKIGNDDSDSIKGDDGKVRPEYRGYGLGLSQAAITAASDHVLSIAATMEAFGTKLDARIEAADDDGVDVSDARTAYDSYLDHIVDAKVQADAAADLVANLSTDDDSATFQKNSVTLKEAKDKLKAAWDDLKEARADAAVVIKVVKGSK